MSTYQSFIMIGVPFYVYEFDIDITDPRYIIIDKYATPQYSHEGEILLKSDIVFQVTDIKSRYIRFIDNMNNTRYAPVYVLEISLNDPSPDDVYINNKIMEIDNFVSDQCTDPYRDFITDISHITSAINVPGDVMQRNSTQANTTRNVTNQDTITKMDTESMFGPLVQLPRTDALYDTTPAVAGGSRDCYKHKYIKYKAKYLSTKIEN